MVENDFEVKMAWWKVPS